MNGNAVEINPAGACRIQPTSLRLDRVIHRLRTLNSHVIFVRVIHVHQRLAMRRIGVLIPGFL
jgi:hypothetical protein